MVSKLETDKVIAKEPSTLSSLFHNKVDASAKTTAEKFEKKPVEKEEEKQQKMDQKETSE